MVSDGVRKAPMRLQARHRISLVRHREQARDLEQDRGVVDSTDRVVVVPDAADLVVEPDKAHRLPMQHPANKRQIRDFKA